MLLTVMHHIVNFFNISSEEGDFSLSDGKITLNDTYKRGQYILLTGSLLVNDIYKIAAAEDGTYTLEGADTDEEWNGIVYGLAVPRDFLALVDEIQAWSEKNKPTGLTHESFGNYSKTMATGADGVAVSWEQVFKKRLSVYRRMFTDVRI